LRLREVAVYVELGSANEAIEIANKIYEIPLSVERRSRFLVDVSRAAYALRDYQRMGESLSEAYALAPEGVKFNWLAQEMFRNLDRLQVELASQLTTVMNELRVEEDPKPS
jgi:hypothetical protein